MVQQKTITLVSLFGLLAACGGSSSSTDPNLVGEPSIVSQGSNPTGITATYDDVDDTLTVTAGSVVNVYSRVPAFDNGALRGYSGVDVSADALSLFGETSTSSGTAKVIHYPDPFTTGAPAIAADIERIGTTQVPVTGSTTYNGDYAAVVTRTDGTGIEFFEGYISGDVSLTANFDDMNVSGTISNRTSSSGPIADVELELSSVPNGAFSGTTTGGSLTGGTAGDGTYVGLLTGSNATEAVGSVIIEHDIGGPRTETGVFIAE